MILTDLIQAPNKVESWTYLPVRCVVLLGTARCLVLLYFWLPAYDATANSDEV
jgi:hypothetical protein